MAKSLKAGSDSKLADQVAQAWRSGSTPPDLVEMLARCESSQSQLEILLVDMRHRWDAAIVPDMESYLRNASLVANDRVTRLELLDRELTYLNEHGSQQQAQELVAAYPELSATLVEPAINAGKFDTVIVSDGQQPTTPPNPIRVPTPLPPRGDSRNKPDTIPSESFGRYEIIRLLGEGGFGAVYLAHDSQLDRQVAIKSLHKRKFSTEKQVKTFLQEARSTASLNHPSIVTLFDVAESSDGSLFAVMEYVDGDSLAGRLKSDSLKLADGIEILVQVAQALGYAHRRGFVHRDLKPGNILIDQEGRARVADLGLAIHEDSQRTHVGELAGTPAYMAPEQVRGEAHRLDGRTDIWSLGVILYQMLTGRLPFSGDTVNELFDEILNRTPRPPRQLNREILPALDRICRICLSRDIDRRYGSAEDVAIDLDECLSTMTAPADQVSIASNLAFLIGGLGLIGVGFLMSFVGGFFVWVTFVAIQFAFGGLSTTAEYLFGLITFSVLSSPFFLGLPTMILGLWLSIVQGSRRRGRMQYMSGKAVAALAFASMTPLLNLLAVIPTVVFARRAFSEIKKSPRVKGRGLAVTAVILATAGMLTSTWMIARAAYVYTAYQAVDRGRLALAADRYDDAIFETQLATSRYPSMAIAWKLRGEALLRAQRPQDATASLTQATNLYGVLLQNRSLEQARADTRIHNTVFHLSEIYRLRSEANAAIGNQQLAAEDAAKADRYRSYTQGKLLPLYQVDPSG